MIDVPTSPKGYEWGLVCYIDILGFRSLNLRSSIDEMRGYIEFAANYVHSCGPYLPEGEEDKRAFCRFQDSLVRVTPLGWVDGLPQDTASDLYGRACILFVSELLSIRNIQINFIQKGLFIRGALTVGQSAVIDGTVVGTGFLKALQLEQNVARYPRVLVDPSMMKILGAWPLAQEELQRLVTLDEDGQLFINYLWGNASECQTTFQRYLDFLKEHQDAILNLMKLFTGEKGFQEKINWLIQFHNREVERVGPAIHQRYSCTPREWCIPPEPHPE